MNIARTNSSSENDKHDFDPKNAGIVGILLFGCFVGSLIGGQTSDRFSRKYSISFFSFVFTIGAVIQMTSSELYQLLTGRFIAGEFLIHSFLYSDERTFYHWDFSCLSFIYRKVPMTNLIYL